MEFPNIGAAKEVWFDVETWDPRIRELGAGWARHDSRVIGFALALDDEPARYWPLTDVGAPSRPLYSAFHVLAWLKDVWESGLVVGGHNIGYDIGNMLNEGLPLPVGGVRDSMVGAALIDERLPHYSLDALGKLWLGESKAEDGIKQYADEHFLDPKADLWRMPIELVGKYAEQDVNLTRKLIRYVEARLADEDRDDLAGGRGSGLLRALALEYGLIPCSVAMRWKGLRIDLNAMDQAKNKLRVLRESAVREVRDRWGVELRPWVASSVAAVFDAAGEPYPVTVDPDTGKRAASFTKPWLKANPSDSALLVLRARAGAKAVGTFIDGWTKHAVGDRLHPEWHQTRTDEGGTISFRYSCSHPNLQQVPHRDRELADVVLPLFIADEGDTLYSLDYHQQEPGLGVHYGHVLDVRGIDAVWERYQSSKVDYHDLATELIEGLRRPSVPKGDPAMVDYEAARTIYKQLNLGLIYGMGKARLVAATGKTGDRAVEIIEAHKREFAFIHALSRLCTNKAANVGWIRALAGHKRRFNLWEPAKFSKERFSPLLREAAEAEWPDTALRRAYSYTGMNTLIQTSAAGQMKKAMLQCFKEGIIPSLQIHDEMLLSCEKGIALRAKEIMIEAVKLTVPVMVDMASGRNWKEAS